MLQAEREHSQNLKQRVQSTGAATEMKLSPQSERARALAAEQKELERLYTLKCHTHPLCPGLTSPVLGGQQRRRRKSELRASSKGCRAQVQQLI